MIIYLITAPKKSWLHPNDGLVVLRKENGRTIDLCRNNIISIFKTLEFITTIQANLKIVDFLDITFDLEMEHMTIIICPSTPHQIMHHKLSDKFQIQLARDCQKTLSTRKYLKNQKQNMK